MTNIVRVCPFCRRHLVADDALNCACGADVMVETSLQGSFGPAVEAARPVAIARHPEKTALAAFRLERRIARNLGRAEAIWFALRRDGYNWERLAEYLRRRGLLP